MTTDILHVRDALSKTIIVTDKIVMFNDINDKETIIDNKYLPIVEELFNFAYNRADGFEESEKGVELNISGGKYPEFGDKVHALFEANYKK